HVEAEFSVEGYRAEIGAISNDRHHLPPRTGLAFSNERGQQHRSNTTPDESRCYINRILDRIAISRSRPIRTRIGIADDTLLRLRDEERKVQPQASSVALQ